jgi:phage FluMu protein Com
MAVLACPHCGTVTIVVGGEDYEDSCPKIGCRSIMVRVIEPEAGTVIRKAFYAHDHGLELDSAIVPLGRL